MKDIPVIDIHTHFHPDLGQLDVYLDAIERSNARHMHPR